MLPVYNFNEIRKIESEIIQIDKIPSIILMENAGKNSFDIICRLFRNLKKCEIYILCGKGNNAGDGYTLARHFAVNNIYVNVINLTDILCLKGDASVNYNMLVKLHSEFIHFNDALNLISWNGILKNLTNNKDIIIVDALLGTGIKGKLDEHFSNIIKDINNLKKYNKRLKIVSIDIPSGLSSEFSDNPVIKADFTLTMSCIKSELLFNKGYESSGEVCKVHIGLTDEYLNSFNKFNKYIVEENDIKDIIPVRKKASYKYTNGKLIVIGGSPGLSGAIALASLSAMRTGCGGVVAAFPDSILSIFSKKNFDIMKLPLKSASDGSIAEDSYKSIIKRIEWTDTVLVGPGLTITDNTVNFVHELITNCPKNIVIDADALMILALDINILKKRHFNNQIILTPHLGEFSKLSGNTTEEIINNRFDVLNKFISENKVNVILKSERTLSAVYNKEVVRYYVNSSGNESLAVAGSGDVLAGIVSSIFSQTGDIYKSCIIGNYIHGMCAEFYYKKYGNKQSATPKNILRFIPKVISSLIN